MADPERRALASDIRILSCMLSSLNFNWRPPQPKQPPVMVMDSLPMTMSHVSTILSIDTDAPVAVLGSATPENINITVVQSTSSGPQEPSRLPFIAHSVTPSMREVDHILMEDDDSETVGVESSVAECLTLFAARQERRLASRTIFKWLVARSWLTLRTQMQRSRDHFQHGDLFELVENWSPALNDVAWTATIPLPHSNVYLRYGFHVSSNPDGNTMFSFGSSTATAFINTLGRILIDVRRTVEDDPLTVTD
ncbi:hypothetical protein V8D89_012180 [Ganoderma adspersum]